MAPLLFQATSSSWTGFNSRRCNTKADEPSHLLMDGDCGSLSKEHPMIVTEIFMEKLETLM
jgi:hypothetical protein